MRTPRALAIVVFLFLLTPLCAEAQSCQCILPPEGILYCYQVCHFQNSCRNPTYPPSDPYFYCYVDTQVHVCFNGGYDPCCDPLCGGPF